ncbi:Uncharacterised protein [uncultured archaeon]|nr:Uncharacterised protein [uncultured archaeon]
MGGDGIPVDDHKPPVESWQALGYDRQEIHFCRRTCAFYSWLWIMRYFGHGRAAHILQDNTGHRCSHADGYGSGNNHARIPAARKGQSNGIDRDCSGDRFHGRTNNGWFPDRECRMAVYFLYQHPCRDFWDCDCTSDTSEGRNQPWTGI